MKSVSQCLRHLNGDKNDTDLVEFLELNYLMHNLVQVFIHYNYPITNITRITTKVIIIFKDMVIIIYNLALYCEGPKC